MLARKNEWNEVNPKKGEQLDVIKER